MSNNIDPKRLDYYICHLQEKRIEGSRNKAILSFRYDSLELTANITQVSIILLSTVVTFLESLKAYYDLDLKLMNIISIILTTLIALIMAIYRFFEIDKKKENVGGSITEHTFIINKFRKVGNVLANMKMNPNHFNNTEFDEIAKTYDNEIYDNYISIRENFDTIFSFKELIRYRRKYRKHYLKDELIKREIELIKKNRDKISTKGYVKRNGILKRLFCCKPRCIDYYGFIYDIETNQDQEFLRTWDRRLSERIEISAESDSPDVKKHFSKRKPVYSTRESKSHTAIEMQPISSMADGDRGDVRVDARVASTKKSDLEEDVFLPAEEELDQAQDQVVMTISAAGGNDVSQSKV